MYFSSFIQVSKSYKTGNLIILDPTIIFSIRHDCNNTKHNVKPQFFILMDTTATYFIIVVINLPVF